jgi:hypothetical protein
MDDGSAEPRKAAGNETLESDDVSAPMQIVSGTISVATLARMAEARFGELVKAVVDIERGLMVVDADMHADEEALLLETGSRQVNLWGINLHPGDFGTPGFVEFDSVINIRPRQGNRSRSVEEPQVRAAIVALVSRLVKR